MGIGKTLGLTALIYIGYQIVTNKKYDSLKSSLLSGFEANKEEIIGKLDDAHVYLTLPKEGGSDKARLAIDEEIDNLKKIINSIDAKKVAKRTNNIIDDVIKKVAEHRKNND
ncbi:MAG: hypothetical protein LBM72_00795 [Mycoplasmataceae bacterium]|jgi:hypothetical protein|nr:hypothetical protein [Mycoplasmataceae bacterium]